MFLGKTHLTRKSVEGQPVKISCLVEWAVLIAIYVLITACITFTYKYNMMNTHVKHSADVCCDQTPILLVKCRTGRLCSSGNL